jgi:hypothetical protein
MNVEIFKTEAAQFPEKEYINKISVAVWHKATDLLRSRTVRPPEQPPRIVFTTASPTKKQRKVIFDLIS